MKKLFIATLLLGSASLSHADPKLVSHDGSDLSALCIAAAESPSNLHTLVSSYGIALNEIDTVRCNDLTLKRFVLKYGKASTPAPELAAVETGGYLLRKNDSSPLTELCAAAAISDVELERVKAAYFSSDETIESELLCNGESLKSFVRKFRDAEVQLVGAR